MRRALEPLMRAVWRGEGGPLVRLVSWGLAPAELLYRAAVAVRARGYDRGWIPVTAAPVPVISVGNLAVGGTGKTPVTAWLARVLLEAGHAPAVLARGYGDDELALHRRWTPEVPVVADPDRLRAARAAAGAGRDVAVLDDGFQHRRLARTLDLVLLAVEGAWVDGRAGARLLPRGPLREPFRALGRADRAVLVRRAAGPERTRRARARLRELAPGIPVAEVRLAPRGWRDAEDRPVEPPEGPVLAVAGIARPDLFRRMVAERTDAGVELLAFPDHHPYTAADVRRIRERARGRPVVTTEKDAVRLRELSRPPAPPIRVLRLAVEPEAGAGALLDAVRAAARAAPGGPRRGGPGEGAHPPGRRAGR